jgi:hypothetical protein
VRRFLDTVQLLLVLASATAVVDATRALAFEAEPSAYHATQGGRGEPAQDRRFGDLARLDRRSREDRQRRVRAPRTKSAEVLARLG